MAIREYTKYMQGVDRLDQFMKYYSFLQKTKRWTKKDLALLPPNSIAKCICNVSEAYDEQDKADTLQISYGRHQVPHIF